MAKRRAFRMRGQIPELERWPEDTQRAAMPEIVKITVTHVRAVAPQRRGLSSPKSIVSRIVGRTELDGERGVVAAKAPHSHLLEMGVRPHSLAPGSGKARVNKRRNPRRVMLIPGTGYRTGPLMQPAYWPWHPGLPARPFMQPGLTAAEGDIGDALAQAGREALAKRVRNVTEVIGELAG